MATAYPGFDVLTHALESFTSRPYDARPRHRPDERPVYVGRNPVSDLWCEKALEYLGRSLRRAVLNGYDMDARTDLALAATYAGIGFGNAGVHVPHALAYPVAGQVRSFYPPDYPPDAAADSAWTFGHQHRAGDVPLDLPDQSRSAHPRRAAARRRLSSLTDAEAREVLPKTLLSLMRDTGIPNGLAALGFGDADVSRAWWTARSNSSACW